MGVEHDRKKFIPVGDQFKICLWSRKPQQNHKNEIFIYGVVRGEAEDNPRIGVCRDGKVGFVDLQGNTVIDFLFENPIRHVSGWTDCYQFSEGLASVLLSDSKPMEDVFGVIDETGKLLFRFSEAPRGAYREGYMVIEDEHEDRKSNV